MSIAGACAALVLAAASAAAQPRLPVEGYRLAWSDEFDGQSLDTAKWVYRTDSKMWSTQKPENISVSGGSLRIAVRKEAAGGKEYTGGGVISKEAMRFGYYEARFKVPPGKGWHSSFWMMKHDGSGGPGTKATELELDAIENDSVNSRSYGVNVHKWQGEHKSYGHKVVETPDLSAGFHVFGCEYTPSVVRYFFDGQVVQTVDVSQLPHGELHVWLTSIASSLGRTDRVDDAQLPGVVEFDYVRFYTKTQ